MASPPALGRGAALRRSFGGCSRPGTAGPTDRRFTTRRLMARAGDTLRDPLSGATVVFRQTAAATSGALLRLELRAAPRWSAGPLHAHPKQEERVEVVAGALGSLVAGRDRVLERGQSVRVTPGTPHTIWNAGDEELRLLVEFRPALRMEYAFETVLGLGRTRTTATPLLELARLLVASRGYRDEFRLSRPAFADSRRLADALRSSRVADGVVAGAAAALPSGAPSTLYALVSGGNPLQASLAAGSLLLPREQRPHRLLLAAVPVHLALSLGWGIALSAVLPRRRTIVAGGAAGLAVAAFDFGIVGRRFPRIRALPLLPQLADHVAYGAAAGAVLARRRARDA